jgi:hypothetical protein
VHHFIVQSLAALGILIASAIVDLGPRADAAYQSVGVKADSGLDASAGAGMAMGDEAENTPEAKPDDQKPKVPVHWDYGHANNAGGGAGSTSGPGSGPTISTAGLISSCDLPPPNLVAHFQTLSTRLALAKLSSSILDPPRTR